MSGKEDVVHRPAQAATGAAKPPSPSSSPPPPDAKTDVVLFDIARYLRLQSINTSTPTSKIATGRQTRWVQKLSLAVAQRASSTTNGVHVIAALRRSGKTTALRVLTAGLFLTSGCPRVCFIARTNDQARACYSAVCEAVQLVAMVCAHPNGTSLLPVGVEHKDTGTRVDFYSLATWHQSDAPVGSIVVVDDVPTDVLDDLIEGAESRRFSCVVGLATPVDTATATATATTTATTTAPATTTTTAATATATAPTAVTAASTTPTTAA